MATLWQRKIKEREIEMQQDNNDHYLIYNALGFTSAEGYQIDFQQNLVQNLAKTLGFGLFFYKKSNVIGFLVVFTK